MKYLNWQKRKEKWLARTAVFLFSIFSFYQCMPFFTAKAAQTNPPEVSSGTDFIWPTGPNVYADAAIVMEVTTGLVLYEKNIYTAYYPASITKIMTALMALENCSMNEIVTMSDAAEHKVYGSRIGLVSGEQVTLKDAMYGMLLESANEVSYAIGEHVAAKVNGSSGSIEEFSNLMNKRAEELGCVNSHFLNPHGLHEQEHYTCAYDMALIGKAAIAYQDFRTIAGTRTYTIPPTNKNVARPLANHHRFIRKTLTYNYAIAGKTGGTTEALTTLVTFAEKDGLTLVAVVLHVDTALHAYEDTINILNFAFDNYSLYNIEESELTLDLSFPPLFTQSSEFSSGLDTLIHVGKNSNAVLPNSANFSDAIKTITYTPLTELVHGDNVIGQIAYKFADKYIGFADIIYYNPEYPVTKAEFEALWPSYMIPPDIVFQNENETYPPLSSGTSGLPENTENDDTSGWASIKKYILPITLGIVSAALILLVGGYFIIVELPHRRRRKAYKRRHNARLHSYKKEKDDEF